LHYQSIDPMENLRRLVLFLFSGLLFGAICGLVLETRIADKHHLIGVGVVVGCIALQFVFLYFLNCLEFDMDR